MEKAASLEAQGRLEEAVTLMRGAHSENPDDPGNMFELARLLIALEHHQIAVGNVFEPYEFAFPWGRFPYPMRSGYPAPHKPEAMELLRRSLTVAPDDGASKSLLGLMLIDAEETLGEGAELVQTGVQQVPGMALAHYAMGWLALRGGGFPVAVAAFDGAVARGYDAGTAAPLAALARFMTGDGGIDDVLADRSSDQMIDMAEAVRFIRRNAGLTATDQEKSGQLGAALADRLCHLAVHRIHDQRGFVDGARMLHHAMTLEPNHPDAPLVIAALMFAETRFDIAEAAVENARIMGSTHPMIAVIEGLLASAACENDASADGTMQSSDDLLRLGKVHCEKLNLAEATALFRRAIEMDPENAQPYLNLSAVLSMQNEPDAALEAAERASELDPENPEYQLQVYLCLLSLARLEEAWPLYEARFQVPRTNTPRQAPPLPRWDGQPLDGKTLLIWREEGIGDEVRFASSLPDAVAQLPCKIILEMTPRLVSLFQRSFPGVDVRAEDMDRVDYSDADYHLPIASLALHFRRRLEDFSDNESFLSADPKRVAHWKARLAEVGDGPKIGIGWRSLNMSWRKRPFNTRLADWEAIFGIPGLNFHNLQCEPMSSEIEAAESKFGISIHQLDGLDLKNDLEGVAALMTALDCVVTTQCWLTHLGGALGVKTYLLSFRPSAYSMGLDVNPWAPNTEVFYRAYGETWEKPIGAVAQRLRDRFDH